MRIRILLAAVLLTAMPAEAQEVPERLTLEDAVRIAKANNPNYLQTLNDVDVAAARERQGWGAFLPDLSTSLNFSGTHNRALTGTGNFGEVLVNPEFVESTTSSASQGVGLSMTLFDGGANLHTLRAARASTRAVDARVAAAELQLRLEVGAAYYGLLQAMHALGVEAELLESAHEQLRMMERRFEIGSARREEVLGAEATVAAQERQMLQAQGEVDKARLRLLQQLGVPLTASIDAVDEIPPVFDPARLDAATLIADALEASPRLVERESSVRAAELEAKAARGSRWPKITASASYGRSISQENYAALFDLDPPNSRSNFTLSASLPIFDRFQTSSAITQAEAAREDAREALRAERLAVEAEVRAALVDLRNAYRSVQLADRALELSQERLALTQERYRTGTSVGFIELQNAIDQAARDERQAIQARFGYVAALITLESKVGREVRP